MKKVFSLCAFICFSLLIGYSLFKPKGFISFNNTPSIALKSLFKAVSIPINGDILEPYNDAAEKYFLRPFDKERWEITGRFENKRIQILQILYNVGWLQEKKPCRAYYDYVVLLGRTARNLRNRMQYAIKLIHQGIKFKHYYIVTGERKLDTYMDKDEAVNLKLFKLKNEQELAKVIWSDIAQKNNIDIITPIYLHSPAIINTSGQSSRPRVLEKLNFFFSHISSHPGSVLIISEQPYCAYCEESLKLVLKNHLLWRFQTIHVVGPAAEETPIAVHLDNLARYLHTIMQIK